MDIYFMIFDTYNTKTDDGKGRKEKSMCESNLDLMELFYYYFIVYFSA